VLWRRERKIRPNIRQKRGSTPATDNGQVLRMFGAPFELVYIDSGTQKASTRRGDLLVTTGQQTTGISDTVYDLTSVLYHAAAGRQVYSKYIEDAEKEGDQDLVEFFHEVRDQDAQRAQKAKSLLDRR
jgi:hypothetical protein